MKITVQLYNIIAATVKHYKLPDGEMHVGCFEFSEFKEITNVKGGYCFGMCRGMPIINEVIIAIFPREISSPKEMVARDLDT